ncbi:MAG TPA: LppX_LprAFG lipoprotein [Dehalococcoidia bacterium]|nr:LppX_LprAFG lipoprotein [Dehalococcoidia bacterium]
MKRLLIGSWLVVALVLAGCGGSSKNNSASATTVPTPTGEQVIQQSAAAVQALQSFHFKFSNQNGTTPLPLGMGLDTAEGDVGVPDKLSAAVKAKAGGINVNVKVIGIGDQTWVTNPFTRDWQKLPGASIRDFADPATLVTSLLPKIQNPQIVGTTEMGGVKTYDVKGTIDSGSLSDALTFVQPGHLVNVEAWIGVDDSLPRRVMLSGPLTADESAQISRQVDISGFNEPINIQPPQ